MAALNLLAGCAGQARTINPVAWWHNLEGGPVAAQRPPPPDVDAPYPRLGTVPANPGPIDPAARAKIYAALAADRANATYEAQQAPLIAMPQHTASGLFAGAAPLPAPDPNAAGAALDATTPTSPPSATSSTPKPANTASPQTALLDDTPIADPSMVQSPLPEVPAAPPPQPRLPGVVLPVTIPALPPQAPPAPPAVAPALTQDQVAAIAIGFPSGSAVLPVEGRKALADLAQRRGAHAIEVIGFGEATLTDPVNDITALRLGLARAQALATTLASDGVPIGSLHMTANAPGHGAAVRLVE